MFHTEKSNSSPSFTKERGEHPNFVEELPKNDLRVYEVAMEQIPRLEFPDLMEGPFFGFPDTIENIPSFELSDAAEASLFSDPEGESFFPKHSEEYFDGTTIYEREAEDKWPLFEEDFSIPQPLYFAEPYDFLPNESANSNKPTDIPNKSKHSIEKIRLQNKIRKEKNKIYQNEIKKKAREIRKKTKRKTELRTEDDIKILKLAVKYKIQKVKNRYKKRKCYKTLQNKTEIQQFKNRSKENSRPTEEKEVLKDCEKYLNIKLSKRDLSKIHKILERKKLMRCTPICSKTKISKKAQEIGSKHFAINPLASEITQQAKTDCFSLEELEHIIEKQTKGLVLDEKEQGLLSKAAASNNLFLLIPKLNPKLSTWTKKIEELNLFSREKRCRQYLQLLSSQKEIHNPHFLFEEIKETHPPHVEDHSNPPSIEKKAKSSRPKASIGFERTKQKKINRFSLEELERIIEKQTKGLVLDEEEQNVLSKATESTELKFLTSRQPPELSSWMKRIEAQNLFQRQKRCAEYIQQKKIIPK